MGRPTRRNTRRTNTFDALAASLPDELRSFDGWLYPNGLTDYMAALSTFLVEPQRLTPVMNAAGLPAADWYRHMLTRKETGQAGAPIGSVSKFSTAATICSTV